MPGRHLARLTSSGKGRGFRRAVKLSKPTGFGRRGNSFSISSVLKFGFPQWLKPAVKALSTGAAEAAPLPGGCQQKPSHLTDCSGLFQGTAFVGSE